MKNKIELLEISRGRIIIGYKDKRCIIQGEGLLLNTSNDISYIIYVNSMKWESPFETVKITTNQKKIILDFVCQYFENKGQKIVIES